MCIWSGGRDVRDLELPPFPASGAPKRKSENGSCQMGRVHLICVTLMLLPNLGNVIALTPTSKLALFLRGVKEKGPVVPPTFKESCLVCITIAIVWFATSSPASSGQCLLTLLAKIQGPLSFLLFAFYVSCLTFRGSSFGPAPCSSSRTAFEGMPLCVKHRMRGSTQQLRDPYIGYGR